MKEFTLYEHISDLKKRIIYSIFFFVSSFSICYFRSGSIISFFAKTISQYYNVNFLISGIGESFLLHLSCAFYTSLYFTFIFAVIQIYLFTSPGLYLKEKKYFIIIIISVSLLLILGTITAHQLIIPYAIKFLFSFNSIIGVKTIVVPNLFDAVKFVMNIIMIFSIIFQLPLFLTFLMTKNIISISFFKNNRRFVVVVSFILGAIFTPPDIMSQIILASILIIMFEISILISQFIVKNE
jgi:sec-independent protein translocase protein TatC